MKKREGGQRYVKEKETEEWEKGGKRWNDTYATIAQRAKLNVVYSYVNFAVRFLA